jgi:Ca-activated chloride channel family protein
MRRIALRQSAVLLVLATLGLSPTTAEEVALTQGVMTYHFETSSDQVAGQAALDMPLKRTVVKAEVSGFIARVTVQQVFANPAERRIEAVYAFPLPANAAVHESAIRIGDRLVVAQIQERAQARKTYENAKSKGKRAALLEQERPNIFTQSVANIGPGDEIVVALQYVQELALDDGVYTFTFPMTVGPRFIPGTPTGHQAGGSLSDTDQVPDASRITPPILPPSLRSGRDIELEVVLRPGFAIRDVSSLSHDVAYDWRSADELVVTLGPEDNIPNKDFVLRYATIGADISTGLLAHRVGNIGYFLMMVQPPENVPGYEAVPKEMVFVLDCSGSMSGQPLATSKALMRRFIAGMNPSDSFQVIRFSEGASALSPMPLANTGENRAQGLDYVDRLHGSGGTMMITGIKAALDLPEDPVRQRMVFFLTDGYIGNETEILAAIRERVGSTRLYSLGVGSAPNRYLIDEMAHEGHGFSQYVRIDQDPEPVVDLFFRRLNTPVLTSVEMDWGDLEVVDALPETMPDLFDRQPVFLIGRYSRPGTAVVTLRGRRGQGWTELPIEVSLPEREPSNGSLRLLWARRKIGDLMRQQVRGEVPEIREEVLGLALEHRLMSKYTSFVAVERRLKEGIHLPLETMLIPSELPGGVSYEGNFGPPQLSWQRIKPGDPVLSVRAPDEATSVVATFPWGERKPLARDSQTGRWLCRFLVPRSQAEGRYRITVHIDLPDGDWVDTGVDYAIDATAPRCEVEASLRGRTAVFTARLLDQPKVATASDGAQVSVIPDLLSMVVRLPQGGYVVFRQDPSSPSVWTASYDLPQWYEPGRYRFRFLAMDVARNTYSEVVGLLVPGPMQARR